MIECLNEAIFIENYDREELIKLTKEANEITKIMAKAKNSSYRNNK